jgi:UDP-N-acetylmuramoyl-tripeptide--D-alanyl-D-alanine ligase
MIALTLAEVAGATGGVLHGPAGAGEIVIDGPVVTDSRAAAAGSLYVARIGAELDGHVFVGAARDAGAVAALTTRFVDELPCVVVPDIQEAFVAVARAVLARARDLRVIGITGSSGKTSTKDLLGTVLSAAAPTIAPEGSFNSEVGVPLTVCRVEDSTRFLVVEMGARGVGHIHYLTTIAPPQVGIVLNVGTAHVGEFGSRDAIAHTKAELVRALSSDGVAVLNADDPVVREMAEETTARVVLVGEDPAATVRAESVRLDASARATFELVTPAGRRAVQLRLVGRHHVGNALAVVATALECGLDLDLVVGALQEATPVSRWRMEVTERADGVTVVNDAYNANPDSMHAALAALAAMGASRRTWAVLGSMLELGDESESGHREVGADAVAQHVTQLVVVGEAARAIADGALAAQGQGPTATEVRAVPTAEAAAELLAAELRSGDVVLFKSSRDAGLRWLGDRIATGEEDPR